MQVLEYSKLWFYVIVSDNLGANAMNIFLSFPSPNIHLLIRLGMMKYQHVMSDFTGLSTTTLLIAPSHLGAEYAFIIDQRYPTPCHIKTNVAQLLGRHEYHNFAQLNQYLLKESNWAYQSARLAFATPSVMLIPLTASGGSSPAIWISPLLIEQISEATTETTLQIVILLTNYGFSGQIKISTAYPLTCQMISEAVILHEYWINTFIAQLPVASHHIQTQVNPFKQLSPRLKHQLMPFRQSFYQVAHADFTRLQAVRADALLTTYRDSILNEAENGYINDGLKHQMHNIIKKVNRNQCRQRWKITDN